MSLIEEIVQGASGEDMTLTSLLLKCQVLVSRLGSKPAEAWVQWELNGYPQDAEVPPYRVLQLIPVAEITDGFQTRSRHPIAPAMLGEDADKWIRFDYRSGIGAIEHSLRDEKQSLNFSMNDFPLFLARQFAKLNPEWDVNHAWGEVNAGEVKTILDAVRSRVLQFALEIEKEYPDAGEVKSSTPTTVERANNIFNTTVYGSAGVVGSANNSQVVVNVVQGDFASLKKVLETKGVSQDDITELQQALMDEPEPQKDGFGPKVAAWIGRMTTKAAAGAWKIGVNAAGGFLAAALGMYYGL